MTQSQVSTAQVIEIRSRRDRNRLLGTYDPARRVLRIFHRGEIIVMQIDDLAQPQNCNVVNAT